MVSGLLPGLLDRYQVRSNRSVWSEKERKKTLAVLILKGKPQHTSLPVSVYRIEKNTFSVRDGLVEAGDIHKP